MLPPKPVWVVILGAEDDHAGWAYFEAVLSSEGYKPIRVSNGMDAVEAVRAMSRFVLVLMDLKMPVLVELRYPQDQGLASRASGCGQLHLRSMQRNTGCGAGVTNIW
jgi:CheY-like chemotaxis protein